MAPTDPALDPQDPLPETSWFWRRLLTFGLVSACLGLVAWIIHKVHEGQHLRDIALALIVLIGLLVSFYLVAPAAEHLTRIFKLSDIIRARLGRSAAADDQR